MTKLTQTQNLHNNNFYNPVERKRVHPPRNDPNINKRYLTINTLHLRNSINKFKHDHTPKLKKKSLFQKPTKYIQSKWRSFASNTLETEKILLNTPLEAVAISIKDTIKVDLRHLDEIKGANTVEIGIDLTEFYTSVEWDILEVPAIRNEKFYTCCDEPYLDITFNITMRRKTLFYTVNLIIPCMGISFLTVLVFYLPSDSGEKVSLSISILLSLTVFFLLLAEIIPPTSLVVPLLGKFVLFTMILDTFRSSEKHF
ncbi:unnamed protein product [Brassicogethes aeneus]|uniref:Uncharacterized protein n=1 Tax=Brassicogethes aeneus TaxID=1431903 RepID=A0A9P0BBT0_BRAAE|nr:unnamed protein product [Brassicogethes aeneus]